MNRYAILITTLYICTLFTLSTQAQPVVDSRAEKEAVAPIIVLTELEVGDKTFELKYKIKNVSDHDIWICDWGKVYAGFQFEVFLDDNYQTLCIQRRLDVLPKYGYRHEPYGRYGRYVRLSSGDEQLESLSFGLPVNASLLYPAQQELKGTTFVKHLVLEIGFYNGDLPEMVHEVLTEAEITGSTKPDHNLVVNNKHDSDLAIKTKPYFVGMSIEEKYGGLLGFNRRNEVQKTGALRVLKSRDDELLLLYTDPPLIGGDVFKLKVDDLEIPCQEEKEELSLRLPPLIPWSRIEIRYEPSMLEYFFPYTGQQRLLSPSEIQHLRSLKTVVVEDQGSLMDFAREISKGKFRGGIVTRRGVAHVTCYRSGKYLSSFNIYDNKSVETEEKEWLWYPSGLHSFETFSPQIQPYELREQCAANLKDLWHRLLLYDWAEKSRLEDSSSNSKMKYPEATEWSEMLARAYIDEGEEVNMKPYKCPSAGEGKCNYAMNPNCRADSPGDMVLLFETKAGWNQHGGPELFTFDKHDPKGGCVLLNDGTVKFIRTPEELRQLRWK